MFEIVDKVQERSHPVGTYLSKSESTQEPDEAKTHIFSCMDYVAIRLSSRKQHRRVPHLIVGLNNEIHFLQRAFLTARIAFLCHTVLA